MTYFGSRKQRRHFSEGGVGMGWEGGGYSPTKFQNCCTVPVQISGIGKLWQLKRMARNKIHQKMKKDVPLVETALCCSPSLRPFTFCCCDET